MDWKWELLKGLVMVCASGYLGCVLGLNVKRPFVVPEQFIWNNNKTYFLLRNAGESTAKNIQIKDIVINLHDTFLGEIESLREGRVIFKFERLDYLEARSTKEIKCSAIVDDKKSDSSRKLLSLYLAKGKEFNITYKDIFGLSYNSHFKLEKDKIITR